MFKRSSKYFWKKQFMTMLSFVVIAGSFSSAFTPQIVKAADADPAPGGVSSGLISWVDVGKSAHVENENVAYLQDLAVNETWDRINTSVTIPYTPDSVNYNPGIKITPTSAYFVKKSLGTIQDKEREMFSVQASENNVGFPWDLGGKYAATSLYGSSTGNLIRTYFGSNSYKDIDVTGYDLKKSRVMNIWSAEDPTNPVKDQWSFALDGKQLNPVKGGDTHKVDFSFAAGAAYIGAGHMSRFNGSVSEVIVYNKKLSDIDRQKVNSYLALKYGLTLKNATGGATDYLASDSTDGTDGIKIWTASKNAGYGNHITGIGLDQAGNLNQKQSKSQETGANVTIALGGDIKTSNEEITDTITNDKSFFTFSDNGKNAEFTTVIDNDHLPDTLKHANTSTKSTRAMERIYKVDKTAWGDQSITLQVDGANETKHTLYLYINEKDPTFPAATTKVFATDRATGKVTLDSSHFADGSYFTYVMHVDKNELETKVTAIEAEGLQEANYPADKWLEFTEALTAAKNALTDDTKTEDEVSAVLAALNAARDALISVSLAEPEGTAFTSKPKFSGTATPGATVTVKVTDKLSLTATADENGNWSVSPATDLPDGIYDIQVTATKDGNSSLPVSKTVQIDTTLPTVAIERPSGDKVFNPKPEFVGTATPGAAIKVKINDDITLTTTADENGKWSVTPVTELPDGTYDIVVTATKDGKSREISKNVTVETSSTGNADKSALEKKANEINGKITAGNFSELDYTQESWANLERALDEAERVLNDSAATQEEVDQALATLEQAEKDLVKLGGELDHLNLIGLTNEGSQDIELTPVYDPNQYKNYYGTVTNNVYGISLNPVAKYPDDTQVKVIVNDIEYPADQWENLPLMEGKENVIKVGVYDKAGQPINEYTYTIFRESSVPADNNLGSLVPSVGSLSPAFDPNQESYTISVSNSVYQIQLTPTTLDPNATIQIRVNNGEWKEVPSGQISDYLALNVGLNNIVVKVTGKDGSFKEYTVKVTRETSSNNGGGSTGNTGGTTPPPTDNTNKPGDIVTTVNGSNVSFASGTVNGDQATVTIDKNKLSGILADGKGHKLGIRVPGNGDVEIRGLTVEDLRKIADTGSSLEIEDVLAIYPVPAGQLDVNAISKQFGNVPISDIAANIKIKRSDSDLARLAREKAAQGGYELLVHPVDLELTFNHDGKTDRAGLLNSYAPKYIALPEGIDPNRITTGVIVYPDGSVFHVPTVVTKVNNRYFALINDLRSSGTYSVIWNPQDFEDVQYHWGRADVNNIAARLNLKGNGDNTFSPNRHVTRSEFAEVVILGLGLMRQDAPQNIYPDVPSTAWYRNAVALADEFDIVRGYTDGNFKGSQQITREQGFAMMARAYRLIQSENVPSPEQIASTLAPYADGDKVASWAKGDIAQLIAAGIIQGNGPDHLSPKAQMTRAEVTALIARMLKVTNLIDK